MGAGVRLGAAPTQGHTELGRGAKHPCAWSYAVSPQGPSAVPFACLTQRSSSSPRPQFPHLQTEGLLQRRVAVSIKSLRLSAGSTWGPWLLPAAVGLLHALTSLRSPPPFVVLLSCSAQGHSTVPGAIRPREGPEPCPGPSGSGLWFPLGPAGGWALSHIRDS